MAPLDDLSREELLAYIRDKELNSTAKQSSQIIQLEDELDVARVQAHADFEAIRSLTERLTEAESKIAKLQLGATMGAAEEPVAESQPVEEFVTPKSTFEPSMNEEGTDSATKVHRRRRTILAYF